MRVVVVRWHILFSARMTAPQQRHDMPPIRGHHQISTISRVKLHIVTRKTLGGLQTDLDSHVLGADGEPVPGLFAAGEMAGFGGGGYPAIMRWKARFWAGASFQAEKLGKVPDHRAGERLNHLLRRSKVSLYKDVLV